MPFYAHDQYTGNGATTTYSITFPYIATTDIVVTLDDVVTTAFTFLSSTQIQFDSAPGSGVAISIKRQTTRSSRNVDFEDGSALPESDLDGNANQIFYIMQELLDDFSTNLSLAADGKWNADSKVIKNLVNGTNNNDAINYGQLTAASLGASPLISIETPGAGDAGKLAVVNGTEDGYEVGSVTLGDLAELDTVDTAQIDDDAITTTKILDANVTNGKLASGAVTGAKIANDTIGLGKFSHNATADELIGYNAGTPANITVGSGLDLTGGALTCTVDNGDLEYITTKTASAVANLDITSEATWSNYRKIIIQWNYVVPATDGAQFQATTSSNSGSSWDTGASDYEWSTRYNGLSGLDTADDSIILTGIGVGNDSNESTSGCIEILQPNNTANFKVIMYSGLFIDNGGQLSLVHGTGRRRSTGSVNGIQFSFTSGNITSGTFDIYGVK